MLYQLQWRQARPNQDMLAQLQVRVPATRDPQGRYHPRPLVLINVMLRPNPDRSYSAFFHHPPALDPRVVSFLRHQDYLFLLFRIRLSNQQERLQEEQFGRVHLTRRTINPLPPTPGVRYGILQRPRWEQPQEHFDPGQQLFPRPDRHHQFRRRRPRDDLEWHQ